MSWDPDDRDQTAAKFELAATLNVPNRAPIFLIAGLREAAGGNTERETEQSEGLRFSSRFVPDGRTAVAMIQGAFKLSNSGGNVTARQGDLAQAGGGGPTKSP